MGGKDTYRIKREEDGIMQCPLCDQPWGVYDDGVISCAAMNGDVWLLKTNRHRFHVLSHDGDVFVCEEVHH